MEFNSIELRYLASCTPLPDRLGIKQCNILKENLRNYIGLSPIILPLNQIKIPFPEIAKLILKGEFEKITPQYYFEDLTENNHNMELYLFSQRLLQTYLQKKDSIGEDAKKAILFTMWYANICSVKLARLDGKIWAYGVEYEDAIDTKYFLQIRFPKNPQTYVFVHGRSKKGNIVIREVTPEEVEEYMKWHKEREAEDLNNPFIRFRKDLEKILTSNFK